MQIRVLVEGDFAEAAEMDASVFGYDPSTQDLDQLILPLLRNAHPIGAFDDERLVGIAAFLDKDLTFPGGRAAPVAAVTWVAVRGGEQRRGILREMMRSQLHDLHDCGGAAVAILTASESGIYGRFGYGNAISKDELTVPAGAALRPGVTAERVREVPAAEAMPALRAVHERLRAARPGYLSRSEAVWGWLYADVASQRRDRSPLRFAVHPDGVLTFRITSDFVPRGPNYQLSVYELLAATPVAAASLWHHALNRALVREVTHLRHGPDEILQDLLVDPRAVQQVTQDHVWLRIVDLDRAVPLRTYGDTVQVTIGVRDDFCPWNHGSWLLELGPAGGSATRADGPADVSLDIRELAAVFLGGTRVARLAAAGLITGDDVPIAALDRALSTPRAPYCPEGF